MMWRANRARVKLVHALVELSSRVARAEQKCDSINTPSYRAGVAFGMSTGRDAGSRGVAITPPRFLATRPALALGRTRCCVGRLGRS